MADEEEYYFEDDYGDGDGDDEEITWETEIENEYAEAKSHVETNLEAAVKGFQGVISNDQDHGKWTFKALKGVYRVCMRHRDDARMLDYYEKMLAHQWSGRTRNDIEKAINKFVDRSTHLPPDVQQRIVQITLDAISNDLKSFDKLWFNMKLKNAQLLLTARKFDALADEIAAMHQWCGEGEQAEQRKGTQKLNVFSLEIQLHTENYDPVKIRRIYQAAMSIKSAMPPPRVLGIIRESGGKMYMRQNQWTEAYDNFFQAFRSFEEAGDPRRIACLKYLVLATMLSGSKINPFDSNEAKSYQQDPEITAMTELISACTNNDIKQFDRVLKDKKHSRSILEDSFLYSYLEPLIRKIRCQVLQVLTKPYRAMKLSYIARELMISVDDAESLCVAMILDGQLPATIDQITGMVQLHHDSAAAAQGKDAAEVAVRDRYALLAGIADGTVGIHKAIASRATN